MICVVSAPRTGTARSSVSSTGGGAALTSSVHQTNDPSGAVNVTLPWNTPEHVGAMDMS